MNVVPVCIATDDLLVLVFLSFLSSLPGPTMICAGALRVDDDEDDIACDAPTDGTITGNGTCRGTTAAALCLAMVSYSSCTRSRHVCKRAYASYSKSH